MAVNPTDVQSGNKMSQLRRSQRVCLRLPITVVREGPGTNVASEETSTLIVSAHGALIQLALTVEVGQRLVIKNTQTMEELVCRAVTIGADEPGKREIGVEFEVPNPRFWRVAFPPSDWTPRSPEAKAPTPHSLLARSPVKKATSVPPAAEKKLVDKLSGPSK